MSQECFHPIDTGSRRGFDSPRLHHSTRGERSEHRVEWCPEQTNEVSASKGIFVFLSPLAHGFGFASTDARRTKGGVTGAHASKGLACFSTHRLSPFRHVLSRLHLAMRQRCLLCRLH